MNQPTSYKRVMLKVSGEALMGEREYGLDTHVCRRIAEDVKGVIAGRSSPTVRSR